MSFFIVLPSETTLRVQPAAMKSGLRSEIGLAVMMFPAMAYEQMAEFISLCSDIFEYLIN